jgi:hypothetical protein
LVYGALASTDQEAEDTSGGGAGGGGLAEQTALQRVVAGRGARGGRFLWLSLAATLFAVGLEVLSTVNYQSLLDDASASDSASSSSSSASSSSASSSNSGEGDPLDLRVLLPAPSAVALFFSWGEAAVVAWFTVEYGVRTMAQGLTPKGLKGYVWSWLGLVDALATFPYFLAAGLLGPRVAAVVNVYDDPLRAFRILRLVRLDTCVEYEDHQSSSMKAYLLMGHVPFISPLLQVRTLPVAHRRRRAQLLGGAARGVVRGGRHLVPLQRAPLLR